MCVFVALDIQHAMRMRHIVSCGLPLSTVFYHIVSYTVLFSGKKFIEHVMCVLIFSTTLSEIFLMLRRTERDMIKHVYRSSCKVPIILFRS
jgi:hypothetical protein